MTLGLCAPTGGVHAIQPHPTLCSIYHTHRRLSMTFQHLCCCAGNAPSRSTPSASSRSAAAGTWCREPDRVHRWCPHHVSLDWIDGGYPSTLRKGAQMTGVTHRRGLFVERWIPTYCTGCRHRTPARQREGGMAAGRPDWRATRPGPPGQELDRPMRAGGALPEPPAIS